MKIQSPVKDFSGIVAGTIFTDGVGEASNANALNYFRRHGYICGSVEEVVEVSEPAAEIDEAVVQELVEQEPVAAVKQASSRKK